MLVLLPNHTISVDAVEPQLVKRTIARGEMANWVDAVSVGEPTGRPPTFPARVMASMVVVRRWTYRDGGCVGWETAVAVVEHSPPLAAACGCAAGPPNAHACRRFERKHKRALDALLGPASKGTQRAWSHGEILTALRDWRAIYGAWPSANDWNPAAHDSPARRSKAEGRYRGKGLPSLRAVQIAFGTWSAALRAAEQGDRQSARPRYAETVAEHEKQAARSDWATAERPQGSKSASFTRSLDAPVGEDGASLYDVLAAQGALEADDD